MIEYRHTIKERQIKMNTVILIPAYKPTQAILTLLRKLNEQKQSVLVVNDGSDESYNKIFKEAENYATVIHQHPNGGKGAALKAGIRYIKDTMPDCDNIITADADGQHTVSDILSISQKLQK